MSFELWHNGIKLSKDNSIKVQWQAAAPPDPSSPDIPADFTMNSLPAAQYYTAGAKNRAAHMSSTNLLGRKSPSDGGGGWGDKNVVQTQIRPWQPNGAHV